MTTGDSASLKDVYDAISDTRKEVVQRIDDLATTVAQVTSQHEHRLTVVEQRQTNMETDLVDLRQRQDVHGSSIGHIKDQLREDEAATKALTDSKNFARAHRWKVATFIITSVGALAGLMVGLAVIHII